MSETVLVTGGTGFVGIQIIFQLLQKGYKVKTTVRSMTSSNKVVEVLSSNGIKDTHNLSFVEANLLRDDNWDEAMADCKYVLSVASPVFFEAPEDENEMIRPAVEGIVRVIKAAKKAGVKRVVMTSNFGAIGFSNKNSNIITTEADWTDPNEKGLSLYEKSKLLAELAAWDFIKSDSENLEFATLNPVAILGKPLNNHISGSFGILKNLFSGKPFPNIPLNIIDICDVADLHIRAMECPEANGQRFIASADGEISLLEVSKLLKGKRKVVGDKISDIIISNKEIFSAAGVNKQAMEASLLLEVNRNVSNEKAKKILGWKPSKNNEEIILSTVDSMIDFGILES